MAPRNPKFRGAHQPLFDELVMEYRRLPPVLEDGAERLWHALNRMGADTASAMAIRDLARSAHSRAADLRKRQVALERAEAIGGVFQGLGNLDGIGPLMGTAATGGYWVALPDEGYEKYLGQLRDGRAVAGLLAKAANGDQKALRRLRKYTDAGQASDGLARGLMHALGAKTTLRRAAELQMRMLVMRDAPGAEQARADRNRVLDMLCDSLAKVTDPNSEAYLGAGFTEDLKEQGRARHELGPSGLAPQPGEYDGYWSLGRILRFADAETPFSAAFTGDVGRDMIAWDRDQPPASWMYIAPPGAFGDPPNLRTADPLIGLMTAASTDAAAAQAVLRNVNVGNFNEKAPTTLNYLVNDRWMRWNASDHGDAFGKALAKAAAGQDATSKLLAVQFTQVRADGIKGFMQADGKDWTVADRRKVDALSGARDSTALILGNHLDDVGDALGGEALQRRPQPGSEVTSQDGHARFATADLDYVLADLGRSTAAYQTLLLAHTLHMRHVLDAARGTPGADVVEAVRRESQVFAHVCVGYQNAREAAALNEDALAEEDAEVVGFIFDVATGPAGTVAEKLGGTVPIALTDSTSRLGELAQRAVGPDNPTKFERALEMNENEKRRVQQLVREIVEASAEHHDGASPNPEELERIRDGYLRGKDDHNQSLRKVEQ